MEECEAILWTLIYILWATWKEHSSEKEEHIKAPGKCENYELQDN